MAPEHLYYWILNGLNKINILFFVLFSSYFYSEFLTFYEFYK